MSLQSDEFLVWDEDQDGTTDVLSQLRETIGLFGSSINALNESSLLLKDELQRTLSAALQRVELEKPESAEEILKEFHKSMKSDDEVRRDYLRRICSRLVATENEKQKLEAELNSLKASQYLDKANVENSPEHKKELNGMRKTIDEIEKLISKLADENSETTLTKESNSNVKLTSLHNRLRRMQESLQKLVANRENSDISRSIEQSWYDLLGTPKPKESLKAKQNKEGQKDKKKEAKQENADSPPPSSSSSSKITKAESPKETEDKQKDLVALLKGVIVQTLTENSGPWNNFYQSRPLFNVPLPATTNVCMPDKSEFLKSKETESGSKQTEGATANIPVLGAPMMQPHQPYASMGSVNYFRPQLPPGPMRFMPNYKGQGCYRGYFRGRYYPQWRPPFVCDPNVPINNANNSMNTPPVAKKQANGIEKKEQKTPAWILDFMAD
ncbi:hypothetical protein FGIG_02147 [Fasciola gigantica]|uniref:Uncharacterized protein n=1 Tax=Fasciola gigantica TaxID=46835 RepID=A0A504Z8A2_FASGI|nr:hypothetical protein FGIG_02147 [Fasciola gigantica]